MQAADTPTPRPRSVLTFHGFGLVLDRSVEEEAVVGEEECSSERGLLLLGRS